MCTGDKVFVIGDGAVGQYVRWSRLRCVELLKLSYESPPRPSTNGLGVRCDSCYGWARVVKKGLPRSVKSRRRSRCGSWMCGYRSGRRPSPWCSSLWRAHGILSAFLTTITLPLVSTFAQNISVAGGAASDYYLWQTSFVKKQFSMAILIRTCLYHKL